MNKRNPIMPVAFDTLAFANKLKRAGADPKLADAQSEATAGILNEFMNNHLATKSDIGELKKDIELLKTDIILVKTDIVLVKKDIASLRVEVKNDINSLRTEVKNDIELLRVDVKKDIDVLKTEVKAINSKLNWLISLISILGIIFAITNVLHIINP